LPAPRFYLIAQLEKLSLSPRQRQRSNDQHLKYTSILLSAFNLFGMGLNRTRRGKGVKLAQPDTSPLTF
jgi:hypothetical protein